MRRTVHSFFHAISFLTRFPVPSKLDTSAWSSSACWYPWVGLFIGGVLAVFSWSVHFIFPPFVVSMLTVTCWVYVTGGLHLDGLMDTADGFGSHRSREKILEIMKDSRTGAMGVLAAILVLGNKLFLLASLEGYKQGFALLFSAYLGRLVMLIGLYFFPYARSEGLAIRLVPSRRKEKWWTLLIALIPLLFFAYEFKSYIVFALLLVLLICWRLISMSLDKIGGLTGDVYGALCELTEIAVLLGLMIGGK